jgi:hypothetical protein
MSLIQTAVLARRNLLHILTDPQQLVGVTVQPLMFLLLFVYVFGGAISGSSCPACSSRPSGSGPPPRPSASTPTSSTG